MGTYNSLVKEIEKKETDYFRTFVSLNCHDILDSVSQETETHIWRVVNWDNDLHFAAGAIHTADIGPRVYGA